MQVTFLQPISNGSKHKGTYTDGGDSMAAVFGTKVNQLIQSGTITVGSIVKVLAFVCNEINGAPTLVTTGCELEEAAAIKTEADPEPTETSSPLKENTTSNVKTEGTGSNSGSPSANKKAKIDPSSGKTPRPIKRDSDGMKTPAHPRIASLAASSRTPLPSPSEQ